METSLTPEQEADFILDILRQEWGQIIVPGDRIEAGPVIDGKDALRWMKNNNVFGWKYNEWPNYFIAGVIKDQLEQSNAPIHYRKEGNFIYFEGGYFWDLRVRSLLVKDTKMIIGHVEPVNDILHRWGHYGLIVINILPTLDFDGSFREWHIRLRGGRSEYIRRRESEGARIRKEKTSFFIRDVYAFFFPDPESFYSGDNDGWLSIWTQNMRNSNNNPRTPKYRIDLANDQLHNRFGIRYLPLNVDPEELDEEEIDDWA